MAAARMDDVSLDEVGTDCDLVTNADRKRRGSRQGSMLRNVVEFNLF